MAISEKRLELIKTIFKNDELETEEEVLQLLLEENVAKNTISEHDKKLTFGQKAADKLAQFAGSWIFIMGFFLILIFWIIINTVFLIKPYDVYPFILLNLVLSCLAAIQAPIIMMSQNRQEEKDRFRAKNDYKVNLKAEIIVGDIYEKLDDILENQNEIITRLDVLEEKEMQ